MKLYAVLPIWFSYDDEYMHTEGYSVPEAVYRTREEAEVRALAETRRQVRVDMVGYDNIYAYTHGYEVFCSHEQVVRLAKAFGLEVPSDNEGRKTRQFLKAVEKRIEELQGEADEAGEEYELTDEQVDALADLVTFYEVHETEMPDTPAQITKQKR